ncbi:hypothetical protein ES288_A07G222500v1 [Gossypium darwinii]|uniref:Uncharacterized protein n=1 Tax=Gossypium darwinii TaxID=34276 RepID=A0A5D2FZ08_GOSDA|nr:hypothetical protein ES288_A07G222500v1 [Gossypium darwinii]
MILTTVDLDQEDMERPLIIPAAVRVAASCSYMLARRWMLKLIGICICRERERKSYNFRFPKLKGLLILYRGILNE